MEDSQIPILYDNMKQVVIDQIKALSKRIGIYKKLIREIDGNG